MWVPKLCVVQLDPCGSMWMHVLREQTAIIRAMAEKEAGSCDTKRHTKRDTKFDMFRMFQMFQNS